MNLGNLNPDGGKTSPPVSPAKNRAYSHNSEYDSDKGHIENLKIAYTSWNLFKDAPKELWVILYCKFIDSVCFISEDYIYMLYFHKEFDLG